VYLIIDYMPGEGMGYTLANNIKQVWLKKVNTNLGTAVGHGLTV